MDNQTQRIWIPPLPQGWEARYDHSQRRYFFINHQTKKTQWDDPRFQSRPSTGPAGAASLGSNTRQSHAAQGRHREHIPMRELSPRHSSQAHRGSHRQEESSLTRDVNTPVIDNLHKEFPAVSKDLITDMFYVCHENVRETREQLKDLGFVNESRSPQNQPQQQQHRQQPAPKPELSESQKRQIANQLKVQFPTLEANVIDIGLSTCDYNLENTKKLLQAWIQRQSPARNTSAPTSGASSSVSAFTSLEPAALPSAGENSPRALSTAGSSSARPASTRPSVAAPSQPERGRNTVAGPSRTDKVVSAAQQLKASDVTKKRPTKGPGKKQTVVTSQPTPGDHAASPSHRTAAKGPDANLRKGPDSSLLITDYEPAQGPDRSLRQGPDRGRALGPLGAKGSDPSLRCGPQSSLLQNHGVASLRAIETHI